MALKNDILTVLEECRGEFVSGQQLAERFGVSRAAVNKVIASIREDGCSVDSVPNRGYRITGDLLSAQGIRAFLPEKHRTTAITVLRETDSTNSEAKRLVSAGLAENAVIAAERQTAGRGRRGRSFFSDGGGVYMTLVLRADASITDAVSVTTRAAVAVAEALEYLTGKKMLIKWVNDIFCGDKKVCGILTEAVSDFESGVTHTLIIGVGINTRACEFPDELRGIAGTLDADSITRNEFIAAVASGIFGACSDLTDKSYIAAYRARSLVIGREVVFFSDSEKQSATALDIDAEGGLLVRLPDGTEKTLRSGEISLRIVSGE